MAAAAAPADARADGASGVDLVPHLLKGGGSVMLTKLFVRVSALSRYQGTLAPAGTGLLQASLRPSSAFATVHCIHGLNHQ
jgi:hypothetical protein